MPTGGTNRSLDLFDVLENLRVLSQPEITTPLAAVDDYLPVTETTMPLADSVTIPNDGHSGVYNWDNATSIWGLAQYA